MSSGLPHGGFNALVPEFEVFDLAESLRFWCVGLGFSVAYQRPAEGFAYLEREGAQVMLSRFNPDLQTGSLEAPLGRGLNLQIGVSDLAPLLASLKALDWPLFSEPRQVWRQTGHCQIGDFEVLVQDPNGYLLRLMQHLGERP